MYSLMLVPFQFIDFPLLHVRYFVLYVVSFPDQSALFLDVCLKQKNRAGQPVTTATGTPEKKPAGYAAHTDSDTDCLNCFSYIVGP